MNGTCLTCLCFIIIIIKSKQIKHPPERTQKITQWVDEVGGGRGESNNFFSEGKQRTGEGADVGPSALFSLGLPLNTS